MTDTLIKFTPETLHDWLIEKIGEIKPKPIRADDRELTDLEYDILRTNMYKFARERIIINTGDLLYSALDQYRNEPSSQLKAKKIADYFERSKPSYAFMTYEKFIQFYNDLFNKIFPKKFMTHRNIYNSKMAEFSGPLYEEISKMVVSLDENEIFYGLEKMARSQSLQISASSAIDLIIAKYNKEIPILK